MPPWVIPPPPFQCSFCKHANVLLVRNSGTQQPSSFLFPKTLRVGEQKHKELLVKTFDVGMFDLNYMCLFSALWTCGGLAMYNCI